MHFLGPKFFLKLRDMKVKMEIKSDWNAYQGNCTLFDLLV